MKIVSGVLKFAVAFVIWAAALNAVTAHAAEESAQKVIVFIVWIGEGHKVAYVEYATEVPTAQACRSIKVEEAEKHLGDFAELKAKGLAPHLACGLAVSDQEFYGKGDESPEAGPEHKDSAEHKDNSLIDLNCGTDKNLLLPHRCGREIAFGPLHL